MATAIADPEPKTKLKERTFRTKGPVGRFAVKGHVFTTSQFMEAHPLGELRPNKDGSKPEDNRDPVAIAEAALNRLLVIGKNNRYAGIEEAPGATPSESPVGVGKLDDQSEIAAATGRIEQNQRNLAAQRAADSAQLTGQKGPEVPEVRLNGKVVSQPGSPRA